RITVGPERCARIGLYRRRNRDSFPRREGRSRGFRPDGQGPPITLSHGDQVSTPRGTGLHGYRWLPLGERAALSITQYHGGWRLLGGFVEITQKKVRKRL